MSRRPPESDIPDSDHEQGRAQNHHRSARLPTTASGPVKPPPTKAEDLDPIYSAYPAVDIKHLPGESLYAYGLGHRHVVPYATWVFEKWEGWSLLDYYAIYFDHALLPVASDIVMADQDRYSLSVEESHVPEGSVQISGLVQRVPSGSQSTSPSQTILVKRSKPGGSDYDPGSEWHPRLIMTILGFPEGSTLTSDNVGDGVTVKIQPYENIRRNDLLSVSWHGQYVDHRVTEDEAAGLVDILVFIDVAVILAGNLLGAVIVRFTVQDVVENPAGDKYRFSKPYNLQSELDPSLRPPPVLERNGLETTALDWDLHNEDNLIVRCFTDRTTPKPNPPRYVIVTVKATLASGTIETVPLPAEQDGNIFTVEVPLSNDLVERWVGGSFTLSFVYYEGDGTIRGQSGSVNVTVDGTQVDMPAPRYTPINLGLVDPDVNGFIHIPRYSPYEPGWLETVVVEHISSTGGTVIYRDTQLAGPEEGIRTVTPDDLAPFNGKGDTQLYYTVNDGTPGLHGGGSTQATRKSQILTIQVGPLIADMPKPELQGRIGNNINPAHVVGNPLLTLPYLGTEDQDRIHWQIIGSNLGGSDDGEITINPVTAGTELKFNVDRKILDLNLNGSLRILYSLERDGPPKVIKRSEVLDLTVGAGVFLGRPRIEGASLSPDELNPLAVLEGATVVAPINPTLATDRIYFDWFTADGIGSATLDAAGNAATHHTSVTFAPRTVAKCIREGGSTIDVQFRFNRGSFPYKSEIVHLRLLPLTNLPTPAIDGVPGPTLDLGQLNPDARTRVPTWPFIHANQRMWMSYFGTKGGLPWTEDTYTANLVTDDGVTNGIRPPTPTDKLKELDEGTELRIEFRVSLAESSDKSTALLFGVRHYTIRAIPETLPHPFIARASGTGPSVSLDPLPSEHDTRVTVSYTGMSGNDTVTLRWIHEDGTYEERTLQGLVGGTVEFNFTSAKVLHRSVNSTVLLKYWVKRIGVDDPIPSLVQTVMINAIPSTGFPAPRINNLADNATLDPNTFTGNALASQAKWALINKGQRVWITLTSPGVAPLEVRTANGALINATEAANGLVNQPVLRSWLVALANGAQITIYTDVTFDGSADRTRAVRSQSTGYVMTDGWRDDFTDFRQGSLGGWTRGAGGLTGVLTASGLSMNASQPKSYGTVIYKAFNFSPLHKYRIAYEVANCASQASQPAPAMAEWINDIQIAGQYSVPRDCSFKLLERDFTVSAAGRATVAIYNYQTLSGGNVFHIRTVEIKRIS
ncbi:YncE family protein [Pseudomonas extremorientalis]|uniref:YncE family protein n=1 Tax=Pseudomonas extremorientalis TaxID=169669 RepID=UPI00273278D3|nr:YncE family protein [Pseudomonas extremorientalis]WLG54547.1 YncE family protein [Pseudomonas extremorientalis]